MLDSLHINKTISVLGYGSLSKQIIKLFELKEELIIFDDFLKNNSESNDSNCRNFNEYKYLDNNSKAIIGLGYKHLKLKQEILNNLSSQGVYIQSLIHESSFISPHAKIGDGVIIYPLCNVDQNVNIENGVLLNNSVTISHDSTIGACCYISPGAIISGNVKIGKSCFIGSGVTIINNVKIGDNVIIAAGTLVTKDIDDNASVIGNPMEIKSSKIRLI